MLNNYITIEILTSSYGINKHYVIDSNRTVKEIQNYIYERLKYNEYCHFYCFTQYPISIISSLIRRGILSSENIVITIGKRHFFFNSKGISLNDRDVFYVFEHFSEQDYEIKELMEFFNISDDIIKS